MPRCSICNHPNAREIDDLIDGGVPQRTVASQFNVTRSSLSRHHHGKCRRDALENAEALWASRLEDAFKRADTDGDARAAEKIATSALRHVREQKKEKVKAAKAAPSKASDQFDIGTLDVLLSILALDQPVNLERLTKTLDDCDRLNRADLRDVFFEAVSNPRFADDLAYFCRDWRIKHHGNNGITQAIPSSLPD